MTTTPVHIYIGSSAIHGTGIFTRIQHKKNSVVFYGKRDIRVITQPDQPIFYIDGHPVIPRIHCPQIGENTYHVYTFDSFMNHSSHPNTFIIYLDETSYYHIATRDIQPNEELTVDYNQVYEPTFPDPVQHQ